MGQEERVLGGLNLTAPYPATPKPHLILINSYSTPEAEPCVYLRQLQLAFPTARCWSSSVVAKITHSLLLGVIKQSVWQRAEPWQEPGSQHLTQEQRKEFDSSLTGSWFANEWLSN